MGERSRAVKWIRKVYHPDRKLFMEEIAWVDPGDERVLRIDRSISPRFPLNFITINIVGGEHE